MYYVAFYDNVILCVKSKLICSRSCLALGSAQGSAILCSGSGGPLRQKVVRL